MKKYLSRALSFIILFIIWTLLIVLVDVKSVGVNNTNIGMASINLWFHNLTGVNMSLYIITDYLSIIPLLVCVLFGILGLSQLIERKSIMKVDHDILVLGLYYVLVIMSYLLFEYLPINYRPVLINGVMEVSYPSSTTLLVLAVMPTLLEQVSHRITNGRIIKIINTGTYIFMALMVMCRLISGVHWLSDIIGGILLSIGLYNLYKGLVGK